MEGQEVSGAVTTEDIRNVLVKAAEVAREYKCDIDVALVMRRFDHWLAEHDREVAQRAYLKGLADASHTP